MFTRIRAALAAHQTKYAEYQAGRDGSGNASESGEHAAGQLEQTARRAAFLFGLVATGRTVELACVKVSIEHRA